MNKETELKTMLEDILWMAARYAHGRHTYAPSMIRQVVANMKRLYPEWEPRKDDSITPPETKEPNGIKFREDWLDDIFNPQHVKCSHVINIDLTQEEDVCEKHQIPDCMKCFYTTSPQLPDNTVGDEY